MRKLKLVSKLLSIMLCCSCSDNRNSGLEIFDNFSTVSNLVDYDIITSELLYPNGIVLLDSILFIKEHHTMDPMIVYYDMSTKFSQGFLRKGNGPGETTVLLKIASCGDTAIQATVAQERLFIYSKNEINNETMPMPSEIIPLKQGCSAFTSIAKLDDETLIFSGKDAYDERTDHTRFCIYNRLSDSVYCFGAYPSEDKGLDKIPVNDYNRLTAYQGKLIVKPDKSKAVMIYLYAVGFDIIDLKTKTIETSKFYQYPKVDVVTIPNTNIRAIKNIPESFRGFIDSHCNNDFIYVLYSDKTFEKSDSRLGRYILKYDWEGNPVCRYILNEEVSSFTIDKYERNLYATMSDEDYGYVIRYQIN